MEKTQTEAKTMMTGLKHLTFATEMKRLARVKKQTEAKTMVMGLKNVTSTVEVNILVDVQANWCS